MSKLCMLSPNEIIYTNNLNVNNNCKINDAVKINQNLFNYNDVTCDKKQISKKYPFKGVIPNGVATGSWPCRNQSSCNYFDANNPIIPEHIRKIDLMSLPPN